MTILHAVERCFVVFGFDLAVSESEDEVAGPASAGYSLSNGGERLLEIEDVAQQEDKRHTDSERTVATNSKEKGGEEVNDGDNIISVSPEYTIRNQ